MDGKICANTFFHQEFFDIRKEPEASRSSCILRVQRSNCSNKNFDGEKFSAKELARARYLLPSGDTKKRKLEKGRKKGLNCHAGCRPDISTKKLRWSMEGVKSYLSFHRP